MDFQLLYARIWCRQDISGDDKTVQQNAINYIKECIDIAAQIGAPVFGDLCIQRLVRQDGKFEQRKRGIQPSI